MERFAWFVFPNNLYEVVKKRKDKTTSPCTGVKGNKVHTGESSHSQSTHAMQPGKSSHSQSTHAMQSVESSDSLSTHAMQSGETGSTYCSNLELT